MPTSDISNERIHLDLFGPLKTSEQGKNTFCALRTLSPNMPKWSLSKTKKQQLLHNPYSITGFVVLVLLSNSIQTVAKNLSTNYQMNFSNYLTLSIQRLLRATRKLMLKSKCSLARLFEERHSINFIEEDLRYKLGSISEKLYRYQIAFNQLKSEEQVLWSSFDVNDITFFLTGQRERTPEYTKFLRVSRRPNPDQQQPAVVQPNPVVNPPVPHPVVVPPAPPLLPAFLHWKLPPGCILKPNPPTVCGLIIYPTLV